MTTIRDGATDVGVTITRIWGDVLAVPVDVNSDFFESGGYSISVVQILNRIREIYGLELSVRDVFDNPVLGNFINIVRARLEEGTNKCAPV